MRLCFVAVATFLLGVGAHAEPPDVNSARPSTEASKNNEEERVPLDEVVKVIETLGKRKDHPLYFQPFSESQYSLKRLRTSQNEPLSAELHHQITDQELLDYHANHITNRQYTLDENFHTDEAVAKIKKAKRDLDDALIAIQEVSTNIFRSSQELNDYIKQANNLAHDYPDANINLVDLMRLDAKTLLDMADAVYVKPRVSENVREVLGALRRSWSLAKLTPGDLFIVLGLDWKNNKDLKSLRFREWMEYMIKYKRVNTKVTTNFHSGGVHG